MPGHYTQTTPDGGDVAAGYHSVALGNVPGQGGFFRACSPDAHTRGVPGTLPTVDAGAMAAGVMTFQSREVRAVQRHPPDSWSLVDVFSLVVVMGDHQGRPRTGLWGGPILCYHWGDVNLGPPLSM